MTISDRFVRLVEGVYGGDQKWFPPTEIFNEGWMLRLLLDAVEAANCAEHPLALKNNSTWSSEVLLPSPFLPRMRPDPLSERETHADAVLGQFSIRPETRAGIFLEQQCKQFVVVEAKMFSNLSSGVKNAPDYDQAARNVACMAEIIARSGLQIQDIERLGFYVIAPSFDRRAAMQSNLEALIEPSSIRLAVDRRIAAYENVRRDEATAMREWQTDWFLPFVDRIEADGALRLLSWEDAIDHIRPSSDKMADELAEFYDRCLLHNRPRSQY